LLLPLTDGGDELLLAHATRAGDTQLLSQLLELGQKHRGETAASIGSARCCVGHIFLRLC
jgi:hypothetical protein